MIYLLPTDKATRLYNNLFDIHLNTLTQGADNTRVSEHSIFNEAIARIRTEIIYPIVKSCMLCLEYNGVKVPKPYNGRKPTMKTKLNCIFNYLGTQNWLRFKIEESYDHTNDCLHYDDPDNSKPIIKTEKEYKFTVKHIAKFIAITSGTSILDKIVAIYDGRTYFPWTQKIEKENTTTLDNKVNERDKDFEIPIVRLPIVFVLDQSNSMKSENRIAELNQGIQWLNTALISDEITRHSIEISIITFNDEVRQILPFANLVRYQPNIKNLKLEAKGNSKKIGAAVILALDNCDKVKREYTNKGVDYNQPWLIIISDCDCTRIDNYEIASKRALQLQNPKNPKLNLIPIVVGDKDAEILKNFSIKHKVIRMNEHSFPTFFTWLKENVEFFQRTPPESAFKFTDERGWGVIE